MAELARVKTAIRQLTSSGADQATTSGLLALYARECAVLRGLRRRHRQWRAETGLSNAALLQHDTLGEPS